MMREFLLLLNLPRYSLCTTLAVRYSPQTIAYAAVYAAIEACGQQLMNVNETDWWITKGLNQNHLKGLRSSFYQ